MKDKGINRALIQVLKDRAQKTVTRMQSIHEERLDAQREALQQAMARVRLENRVEIPMPETAVSEDLVVLSLYHLNFSWSPHDSSSPDARRVGTHCWFCGVGHAADCLCRSAGTLSGGERIRAALIAALAQRDPPQLLLLDEPTNNLDLPALEALESALCRFEGALVVVSHEETFLQNIGVGRRHSVST